jgi:tetratricopeptide (TPR) repeat protein
MRFAMNTVLTVCLLQSTAVICHAQRDHLTTLTGQLRTFGGGRPAGVVRVQLQRLGYTVQEYFSADGAFQFSKVLPGRYTVVAEAVGYETATLTVDEPGDLEIVVLLRPSALGPPGEPAISSVLEYQIPRSARRQFEMGKQKLRKDDCVRALEHLNEAVRIFAKYADAQNAIGNCHVRLQNLERAEEAFKKAVALTVSVYPALNLADLYVRKGQTAEAEEVLINAIRRSPSQGDGYYGLALVYFQQDRFQEAEQLAQEAHNHQRHISDVHLLLAKIYQRRVQQTPLVRELQLYVKEAKPGTTRDRIEKMLKESGSDFR